MRDYPKKFSAGLVKGYRKGGSVDDDSPVYKRSSPRWDTPAEYNYNLRERFKDTDQSLDLDSDATERARRDRENAAESTNRLIDKDEFDDDTGTKYKSTDDPSYEGYRKGGVVKKRK